MSYEVGNIIGRVVLAFSAVTGLYYFKRLNIGARIILLLVVFAAISEQIATYFAYEYKNNYYVYGLYNPIQLLIICFYFNAIISSFKKNGIAIIIGIICFVFGIVNYLYIQLPHKMNSYFLLVECLVIISFCLYFFYELLLSDDNKDILIDSNFWFTALLLLYWTSTFLIWGLYDFFRLNFPKYVDFVSNMVFLTGIITYLGFGTVFLLYKKMQTTNGR